MKQVEEGGRRKRGLLTVGIVILIVLIALALVVCKALGILDFKLRRLLNETVDEFIQLECSDSQTGV